MWFCLSFLSKHNTQQPTPLTLGTGVNGACGLAVLFIGKPASLGFLGGEGVEVAVQLVNQAAQLLPSRGEGEVLRQVRQPLKLGRVVQRAASHGERQLAALGSPAHLRAGSKET